MRVATFRFKLHFFIQEKVKLKCVDFCSEIIQAQIMNYYAGFYDLHGQEAEERITRLLTSDDWMSSE